MNNNFQVLRSFPGGPPVGEVIGVGSFSSPHRAAQLVNQRFLSPVRDNKGYQPGISALLAAPIRELRVILPDVLDVCVLQEALMQETREVAKQIYAKRIGEMMEVQNAQSNN